MSNSQWNGVVNMGQYWVIVNEDKEEYLNPDVFGDGLKLMEFSVNQCSTMTGLALLLADGEANGRGGGDFHQDSGKVVGRWFGDRIKIVGDYGDDNLWNEAQDSFNDISKMVLDEIKKDDYVSEVRNSLYGYRELKEDK